MKQAEFGPKREGIFDGRIQPNVQPEQEDVEPKRSQILETWSPDAC